MCATDVGAASSVQQAGEFSADMFQSPSVGFPLLRQESGDFWVQLEMGGGFLLDF